MSRVFPSVGVRLLRRCFKDWPIRFSDKITAPSDNPEVTIVVGVRGRGRLPQFRATLASLMGQTGCEVEIVVVEQSWVQQFTNELPPGVRYVYTKTAHPDMPFNRSWALNVGTRSARGRVVVLHDADMVVPQKFARTVSEKVSGPVDGMRISRLIFYLDSINSTNLMETLKLESIASVDTILHNARTPIALTREALLDLGGHDESFWGWGGEDNEFIDRARTLRFREGAIFPLIHLWHETAPNRMGDRNREELKRLMEVSAEDRVKVLRERPFGEMEPSVPWTGIG